MYCGPAGWRQRVEEALAAFWRRCVRLLNAALFNYVLLPQTGDWGSRRSRAACDFCTGDQLAV